MRVRNTHHNRPLMCSGLHMLPGVWHEVDEGFRIAHQGVPDLEFVDEEPATLSPEPPTQPTDSLKPDEMSGDAVDGQAAPYSLADDLGYAHAAAAEDEPDAPDPYEQGREAALAGQPENSSPYPDGRTKDAKEWRRGWRAAFISQA